MTRLEYETLKQKIETNYRLDLGALERIWVLFDQDSSAPIEIVEPKSKRLGRSKKLTQSEAMKAAWARRRAKASQLEQREKPLSKKRFNEFLVTNPSNGKE